METIYEAINTTVPTAKPIIAKLAPSPNEDMPLAIRIELLRDAARCLHDTDTNGLYSNLFTTLDIDDILSVKFQPKTK